MAREVPFISTLLIALFTFTCLSLVHTPTVIADDETGKSLVEITCKRTDHSHACITILESDPRSNEVTNLTGLCRLAVEISQAEGSAMVPYISSFLKNAANDDVGETLRNGLGITVYARLLTEQGLASFDNGKYEDADMLISNLRDTAFPCNTSRIPSLTQRNDKLLLFFGDTMTMMEILGGSIIV